jgi:hypothetical protein
MLDLFEMANANGDAIQAAFESLLAGLSPPEDDLVREFATWVEAEALISINARLFVIVELLTGGHYQNIYEWAEERSRLSGRSAEDILRERLHEHYGKRMAFDRAFKGGELFCYGTLNAGGIGSPQYSDTNPYAIVLGRPFYSSLANVAYLPGDSLTICFTAEEAFDEDMAMRCAAPHTHRHILAAKECGKEVLPADKRGWPDVLVSKTRYFEAVFIGTVSIDEVSCIRVLKSEYERMWDLAFADFGRKTDNDATRALMHDFIQLRRAVVNGTVLLEVIE